MSGEDISAMFRNASDMYCLRLIMKIFIDIFIYSSNSSNIKKWKNIDALVPIFFDIDLKK